MLVQPTVPEMELLQSKRSTLYTHFFIKGHKWPIQKWHTPCWGQFGLLCLWYSKCLVLQLNGFPLQYIYSLLKHQHKPFPASLSSSLTNSSPAAVKSTMLPHEVSLKHGKAIQQKLSFWNSAVENGFSCTSTEWLSPCSEHQLYEGRSEFGANTM